MNKAVAAALGAMVGGVLGALAVILGYMRVYDPSSRNWDFVSPILVLLVAVVGALLMAGVGAHTGVRLATHRAPEWRVVVPVGAVVVTSPFALYIFLFVVLPRIPARSSPSTTAEIETWRAHVGAPSPGVGLQLAHSIEGCVERPGLAFGGDGLVMADCANFKLTRGDRPDPSQRRGGDNGWRWRVEPAPPEDRIVVYADELLGGNPPVFEVWQSKLVVTRAHPGAPAYIVGTDLPVVQAYRDCLEVAANKARLDGTWNGDWRTLVDIVGRVPECPNMRVTVHELNSAGNHNIDIFVPSLNGTVRIAYRPSRLAGVGFELVVSGNRRYLMDRNGRWHVTTRMMIATEDDPPPLTCELRPTVPCDEGR